MLAILRLLMVQKLGYMLRDMQVAMQLGLLKMSLLKVMFMRIIFMAMDLI